MNHVSVTATTRAALGCLVLLAALEARPADAAPPGFAFLEIPAGARAAALGGAYVSLASGAEAIFWNPAGLAVPTGIEVTGGHSELIEKLRHDYFALSGRAGAGSWGASVRALYSEPIEERDETGTLIGSFGSHDLEFALAWGGPIANGVRAGLTAQILRERIANAAASTYGFGGGATWEPSRWPGLRAAIATQSVGPAAHYTFDGVRGEGVSLPSAVQGGLSYALPFGDRTSLRAALEARATRGRSAVGVVGAELGHLSGASLRFGARFNDDASTWSAGAGYGSAGARLDYAFVPYRLDLGDTHRFSFTTRF